MDAFYTPKLIAEKMIKSATLTSVASAADFAAGDGGLLRAVETRWPDATITACEIDPHTADYLSSNHSSWEVYTTDFMTAVRDSEFDDLDPVSLIVLNPPFSCRGATTYSVEFGDEIYRASYGLAYTIAAMEFLAPAGQLIALLPSGTLTSQKDAANWQRLRCRFEVEVLFYLDNRTFRECSAETVIVRFSKRASPVRARKRPDASLKAFNFRTKGFLKVGLFRGKVSMNEVANETGGIFPLVHTTELKNRKALMERKRALRSDYKPISGPAVLIPRVGRPTLDKVALLSKSDTVVLSDCVIALRCDSERAAASVRKFIDSNWKPFSKLYSGTCAKYITLRSIERFLQKAGISVNV